MSNVQTQINDLSASLQSFGITFSNVSANIFTNYNQLSSIVAQQGNVFNTVYYGTGTITTGNISCGDIIYENGVGLGKNDGTVVSVIQSNDNYYNGNITPVTLDSSNLPFNGLTRQTSSLFTVALTAATPIDILTLIYRGNINVEGHIWIKIEAMITASTTTDASTKSYNLFIVGSRANSTSSIFTFNSVELTSITSSTTPASLNLGSTTITYPTNTSSTTTIALTQAITGTPSQSFFITGQYTVYHTRWFGDAAISSISY
jgi:hypothetical protein